jgi:hypothetical protein
MGSTGYISIRTKEGTPKFRRAERGFTRDATILRVDELDEEALKEIRAEPLLEVEDLSEAEALKRGALTDGRLPLEKAYGDYPPPGQGATSGVTDPPENPKRAGAGSAGAGAATRPASTAPRSTAPPTRPPPAAEPEIDPTHGKGRR